MPESMRTAGNGNGKTLGTRPKLRDELRPFKPLILTAASAVAALAFSTVLPGSLHQLFCACLW